MAGHFWVTGTAVEAALVTTLFELCCSILSGIIIQITTVVCSTNIYSSLSLSSFCYTEKPCFEIGKEERKTPGCASSPEEGDKEEFKKSLRVGVNLPGWVATWWTNTCAHMALRGALEKEKSRPIRIRAALDHSASAKGKSPERVGGRWGGGCGRRAMGEGGRSKRTVSGVRSCLHIAAILILGRVAHLRQNTETEAIFCDLLCSKPFQATQVLNWKGTKTTEEASEGAWILIGLYNKNSESGIRVNAEISEK